EPVEQCIDVPERMDLGLIGNEQGAMCFPWERNPIGEGCFDAGLAGSRMDLFKKFRFFFGGTEKNSVPPGVITFDPQFLHVTIHKRERRFEAFREQAASIRSVIVLNGMEIGKHTSELQSCEYIV